MKTTCTGKELAAQAVSGGYMGIPYEELDCQGFVERVLADCGVLNPETGKPYNWTGSNKMWRVALKWKGTYAEAVAKFGSVPDGAWLFTVKRDGGEKERGYNDNEGNASHVGLKIPGESMHSSTGGVQIGKCPDKNRWTHVGLPKMVVFDQQPEPGPLDPLKPWETVTVNASAVAIRKGPSTECGVMIRAPKGEKLTVQEWPEDWVPVEYKGNRGYMMREFLDKEDQSRG